MLQRIITAIRNQPLIVAGAIATGILAVAKSLAGDGLIEQDLVVTLGNYLDPTSGYIFLALTVIYGWFKVTPTAKLG